MPAWGLCREQRLLGMSPMGGLSPGAAAVGGMRRGALGGTLTHTPAIALSPPGRGLSLLGKDTSIGIETETGTGTGTDTGTETGMTGIVRAVGMSASCTEADTSALATGTGKNATETERVAVVQSPCWLPPGTQRVATMAVRESGTWLLAYQP